MSDVGRVYLLLQSILRFTNAVFSPGFLSNFQRPLRRKFSDNPPRVPRARSFRRTGGFWDFHVPVGLKKEGTRGRAAAV